MNAANPHRVTLTVLVGLAAVAVIAGLAAASPELERLISRLPAMPTATIGMGFAGLGVLIVVIWLIVQLSRSAATRARRNALASTVRGELSCGIRNRELVQRLSELDDTGGVRLGARYSIIVDELGVAFWNGAGRPHRAVHFPWPEVRNIRADSMVVGGSVEHVLVLRVRHNGSSVELPVLLSAGRFGRYAMSDAPFFAVVRSWKAKHRAALAAEGIEPPPLTAPTPVIRPEAVGTRR